MVTLSFYIKKSWGEKLNDLEKETALFLPTLNGGVSLSRFLSSLEQSTFTPSKLYAVDSGSTDDTVEQLMDAGFTVGATDKKTFTHGKVRREAISALKEYKYVIMVTQDIELTDTALFELVKFINQNSKMGAAYGKQIAFVKDKIFSQDELDKNLNYPDVSTIKSYDDKQKLGLKTVFNSDAFSVYRTEIVQKVGSFPEYVRFSEDMYIAAVLIMNGFQVGYCSEAEVRHSNVLPKKKLFERYKQIGQFHHQFPWIQNEFGKAEGQGIPLVVNQLKTMLKHADLLGMWNVIANSTIKYAAFRFASNSQVIEKKAPEVLPK